MRRLLERASRPAPDATDAAPIAAELRARVFAPIAELPEIQAHLEVATRVVAIGREGLTKEREIGTRRAGAATPSGCSSPTPRATSASSTPTW